MSRPSPNRPPVVLAFAASDPTGGAGLQADLLTLASLGCHPLSVVTGLTVQDTRGVERLEAVEPALVHAQATRLLAETPVQAFKLGVLASAQNAEAIAQILAAHAAVPVVFDPVLASGRGDPLADEALQEKLRRRILPLSTLVTPNSAEARRLAGETDLARCAAKLIELGARHVLVTGGHEAGAEVRNVLYGPGGVLREDRWPRLPGEYHGSGCTLASAIAAGLAKGLGLSEAVGRAQAFTWSALESAFATGRGQLIPDRFFQRPC